MEDQNDAQQFERQKVAKGRRIFNEGETGDYAYIVETGEVGIFKRIEGNEVELAVVQPGEIFGEVAVLDGRERMASAIATVETSLIVVSPTALEERIAKSDKFVQTLLQIFMTNLRETHKTYKDPKHSFDGHIQALTRHVNAMRELARMTKMEDFSDECEPHLLNIKRECDKLYHVSKKFRKKIEG